jgi:alpha-galactosidase
MKRFSFVLAAVLTLGLLAGCGPKGAGVVTLDTGWKFMTGDNLEWARPQSADSAWKAIRPDRTWENQGAEAYDGYAWYRNTFVLPEAVRARSYLKDSLQIVLGMIDDTDQTFLNGKLIGQNAVTVTPAPETVPENFTGIRTTYNVVRRYVLAADDPRILWGGRNTIAVRVNDHGGGGGMYSQIPSVSMVDLRDFVQLDYHQSPFVPEGGSTYSKKLVVRNLSGRYEIRGTLSVKVLQLNPKKTLFQASKLVVLAGSAEVSESFRFDVSGDSPTRVVYAFSEPKSGLLLAGSQEIPYILTPTPPDEPRINGAGIYGQRPGMPFLYRIAATGALPMSFEAEGLPAGLKIDGTSGIITGAVAKAGDYGVRLKAKNTRGEAVRDFKIVIGEKLALTPPMGWNSWNCWGLAVDDAKVRAAADAFEKSGLADHGWTFINIDDGWEDPVRRPNGEIRTNSKFPDMKATADYVHSKGLKMGIYSSPGPQTCGGYTGSYRHELQDARSYARWGIDYLKYDWCSYGNIDRGETLAGLQKPYRLMRECLDKVPRDIVFSLCQYGMGEVWEWGSEVGGNCWRTTGDITDSWRSLSEIGFEQKVQWRGASPGHWNDPDMLIVGWVGWGPTLHPTGLTVNEQYTHISLWCLLSSPLLIGCDLTRLDAFTLNLLTNDEVLAVNQDPLGKQAKPVFERDSVQVWARPLEDGSTAMGVFNLSQTDRKAVVTWKDLGLSGPQTIRDLWRQKDLGVFTDKFEVMVYSHGVSLVKASAK